MNIIRNATIFLMAGFIILIAFGCKKSFVDQMAKVEKKACACADKGCADGAFKDLIDVYDGFIRSKANTTLPTEELTKFYVSYGKTVGCLKDRGVPFESITAEINKVIDKYR
ncbi:MAG: hypothetical protein KA369_23490 [Spirochaetes bacterium]|nr:hypothetical protein [Spirochaetota bacterium]